MERKNCERETFLRKKEERGRLIEMISMKQSMIIKVIT